MRQQIEALIDIKKSLLLELDSLNAELSEKQPKLADGKDQDEECEPDDELSDQDELLNEIIDSMVVLRFRIKLNCKPSQESGLSQFNRDENESESSFDTESDKETINLNDDRSKSLTSKGRKKVVRFKE